MALRDRLGWLLVLAGMWVSAPAMAETETATPGAAMPAPVAVEAPREVPSTPPPPEPIDEAAGLLALERQRLADVAAELTAVGQSLVDRRAALAVGRAEVTGWQQRAVDWRASADTADTDAAYDNLRSVLRTRREALSRHLDHLAEGHSIVPRLPAEPAGGLLSLPAAVGVLEERTRLAGSVATLRREELALQKDEAAAALEAISALNADRLELLEHLSPTKRDRITGFNRAALDQAGAEAWHLALIARYHAFVIRDWVTQSTHWQPATLWWLLSETAPLVLVLALFVWLRRFSTAWLLQVERQLADRERAGGYGVAGRPRRAVQFIIGIVRPVEWILLFEAVAWLLPATVAGWLEVRVAMVIIGWALAVSLVVHIINASLAVAGTRHGRAWQGIPDGLRLRSLKLVGHAVAAIGVLLSLTAELVGNGTVYHWVLTLSWLVIWPVGYQLVQWWRGVVFTRLGRLHRRNAVERWALENREGAAAAAAVAVGGGSLLLNGGLRMARRALDGFDIVRRAHAVVFRQEIDRLSRGNPVVKKPMTGPALEGLSPATVSTAWIACPADAVIDEVVAATTRGQGAVLALVGYRGTGKSSVLRALANRVDGAVYVDCALTGDEADLEHRCLVHPPGTRLVLVDDAQRLFKPAIGGLHLFDRIHAQSRVRLPDAVWLFVLEETSWPFLSRARDQLPLFDRVMRMKPWSEEGIAALLAARSAQAGIDPAFDDLLGADSDAIDADTRLEELENRRDWFSRLLWDHARGNPGLALEAWRRSLVVDDAGKVFVRTLASQDLRYLERLPIAAHFLLRTLLQMEPVTRDELAEVTRLPAAEVASQLAAGLLEGFIDERDGRYAVSWCWLRSVRGVLERQHLLVEPQ